MLENFDVRNDDKKRQLYVAMTRAKENLTIHLNGSFLDNIFVEELVRSENVNTFQRPRDLALQLSHKELYLGYFEYVQHRVNNLMSGDQLKLNDEGCLNEKGELVLKFSKKFLEKLGEIKTDGYRPSSAKVNFIVYWTNEDNGKELKVVLPELYFER